MIYSLIIHTEVNDCNDVAHKREYAIPLQQDDTVADIMLRTRMAMGLTTLSWSKTPLSKMALLVISETDDFIKEGDK
jgi:hypothetical protein